MCMRSRRPAAVPCPALPAPPNTHSPTSASREAFALLSSTHPLVPSQLLGELKKPEAKEKGKKRGQVTFQWRPFANPGRADGLQLEHWVKCYRDSATGAAAPADKEYAFAKYNKPAPVLRYNDDEWVNLIAAEPGWSREETDLLLDLAERLDLRWTVIADRWPPLNGAAQRSVEDLKARYYAVARQLLVGREGGPESVAHHTLVRHPYSAQYERERKEAEQLRGAVAALSRCSSSVCRPSIALRCVRARACCRGGVCCRGD